jgi:molecular chaperone HscB
MRKNGSDHFALFGLAPRFAVDEAALTEAYQRVQSQVHPDRFAASSAPERRVAAQWAARANEALTVLRSPVRRAIYLCETNGVPIEAESNTAMPAAFLMRQMQWREQLDDARAGNAEQMHALSSEVGTERDHVLAELAGALDRDHDYRRGAELARQLMFIERFRAELGDAGESAAAKQRAAAGKG